MRKKKSAIRERVQAVANLLPDDMVEVAINEGWTPARLLNAFSQDVSADFYVRPTEYQIRIIEAAQRKLSLAAACKEAGVPYFVGRWWYTYDKDFHNLFNMARDAAVDMLESSEYEHAIENPNTGGGKILRAYRTEYQPPTAAESKTPVRVRVVFGKEGGGAIEVTSGSIKQALLGEGGDE